MRFAGYAALFGTPDAAHDTVMSGAFRRTLADRGGPLPLFWQHKPDQQIGWIEAAQEDERGLRVIAQLDNPNGRAASLIASRQVDGLSFGYRAQKFRKDGSGRKLEDIDLFEVSLVSHPLQHGARVHLIT
jgi:HK97 family phage prohead protease